MICPKCKYEQNDNETECRKCGIIFEKYHSHTESPKDMKVSPSYRNLPGKIEIIRIIIFYVPDKTNVINFGGRALTLLLVFVIGCRFVLSSVESVSETNTFLHLINTPFHEAGHIFFGPFGSLIRSLGGTLGQLLMPLVCMFVLLLKTRDTFGASVAFWWFGENFIDIAPYINDARSGTLPLLGGNTGENSPYGFHDWEFVLTELNLLKYDHAVATISHKFGILIMLLAYLWGGYVLMKQYRNLSLSAS